MQIRKIKKSCKCINLKNQFNLKQSIYHFEQLSYYIKDKSVSSQCFKQNIACKYQIDLSLIKIIQINSIYNIPHYKMINFQPITYSINNLPLILTDIEKRTFFLRKAVALLDKKADIDINYSIILDNLITKDYLKPTQEQIPSQYLYKNLVSILQEDAKRMKKLGEILKTQSTQFQKILDQVCPQVNKTLNTMKSITKDLTSQREKLQRSRTKFEKKSKQLEQLKIQHISSFLGNDQRQSTNQLYLQVSSLEDSISSLRQDYKTNTYKYNDLVQSCAQQFKTMLTKLEAAELHKINGLKALVTGYLQIQKDTLNDILRQNPFLKADMDSVRLRDELQPHTEDILNQQRIEMLLPYSNEVQYIDCIYDRISVKKNLEQIIIFGDKDHKRQVIDAFNCQNQNKTLNCKTLKMIQIFRSAFQGQATGEMMAQLKVLLTGDEKLRKDFMQCLQKYRINNEFCLRLSNKSTILESLQLFLNSCDAELDTYNSKMLMILSLTYHFQEDGKKTELQELISSHFIWKRIGWWQAALLQSIFQETRVKVKKQKVPITAWDIKAGGVSFKEQGQQITYQHICFNQLLYYIRNMGLFHLSPQSILQYARDNIKLLKFTGKFAKDILELCPQLSPLRQR